MVVSYRMLVYCREDKRGRKKANSRPLTYGRKISFQIQYSME